MALLGLIKTGRRWPAVALDAPWTDRIDGRGLRQSRRPEPGQSGDAAASGKPMPCAWGNQL
jgi:hypothetical protein